MHFLWIYIQTPTHPRCIIQVRFSTMWPPRRKLVFYMKIKHWTKNTWPCSAPASLQTGQSEPNITRLLPKTFKQCDTKVLQRIYYVWCLTNNTAETWKCLAPLLLMIVRVDLGDHSAELAVNIGVLTRSGHVLGPASLSGLRTQWHQRLGDVINYQLQSRELGS